ncbi:MAG: LysM domain-containing protein [Gammaproteobacteria bacterium]|nr:LysM domain-containing protein [Gammaproteobacteria bacterium]
MPVNKRLSLFAAALLVPLLAFAQSVELNPDHPTRYVVKKGDTLWDISAHFLVEPWRWPEIWQINPQVHNPHLIYPGDELALFYRDGQPVIQITRRGEPGDTGDGVARRQVGPRTVKLTPEARVTARDDAVPTIPIDVLRPFLDRPRVLGQGEFESAPYVVSVGRENLLASLGQRVFVRGIQPEQGARFGVYRQGQVYRDPSRDDEVLGFEAIHVADALVEKSGDPATVLLLTNTREVRAGDRLFPVSQDRVVTNFMPRAPKEQVDALIISVVDGVTQIGENDIVVLNRGTRDGMAEGLVLGIFQSGDRVRDVWATQDQATPVFVDLPEQRAGTVMVFRPFERVSYALVMQATRAMHVHDAVKNP